MTIDIIFAGRKLVSAHCLEHLAIDKRFKVVAVITDDQFTDSVTLAKANQLGLKILSQVEVNDKLNSGKLRFDLGISMLFWKKIEGQLLEKPSLGFINFHPAPLPEYKGTAGYNVAILEGLKEWAVSAHYIDQSIDTGPIIEVQNFSIDPDMETVSSIEKTSQSRLLLLFKKTLNRIAENNTLLPTIANIGGRYISRLEMEALKEIKDGEDIKRKIRAFWYPPYDGAYINIDDQKYTLVDRDILQTLAPDGETNLHSHLRQK